MGTSITITGYLILGCATASFYKAIEQVIVKKAGTSNYALFSLLLCMSYLEGAMGLFFKGATAAMPPALFVSGLVLFIMSAYLAGPLAYAYYNSLINPGIGGTAVHLIPAVAAGALSIWLLAAAPSSYIVGMRDNFFLADHGFPMHLLMACAVLSIVIYTSKILIIELSVRNSPSIKLEVRSMITITAGLLLSPVALLAGFLTGLIGISAFGAILLIFNNLLFILAHVRYHDFFQALGREVRQARYRKKILQGMDTALLQERLTDLMEGEKYYRNFELSMKSTADMLSITPHQLSFFLNKKLRVDFRKYINGFRVEEAKKLLADSLDQNVLTIGFHVGFGSKTSFNVAFKEFTGKTPTEYREEHVKRGP
jgi:AraC-like DNA-binding protein